MVNSKNILSSVEEKCVERGIRLTPRRRQVLDVLVQAEAALSAYEIAQRCNADSNSPMPAMSVYRILDFLQEQQFVHRLETANKYVSCSHLSCAHEHLQPQFLICNSCRRVEEIDLSSSAVAAMASAASAAGFASISSQLEVRGLCEGCVHGNT